jgi:hypothetical protein
LQGICERSERSAEAKRAAKELEKRARGEVLRKVQPAIPASAEAALVEYGAARKAMESPGD